MSRARSFLALVASSAALLAAPAAAELPGIAFFELPTAASAPIEGPAGSRAFVLDDGSFEGVFGVTDGANARQFLWFDRFDAASAGDFALAEVHVFFPQGPNMAAGEPIDLVVYHDPDGDPTNGADLVIVLPEVVQSADGSGFSVYPIAPTIPIAPTGDLLIGVIPRWITSGVDPITRPALLDTTATQMRSWVAVWTGDPPSPPTLPADQLMARIGTIGPAGNWAIRAFGVARPAVEIPALGALGLAALALGLAALAIGLLRRRA